MDAKIDALFRDPNAARLHVQLDGVEAAIWRRLVVPAHWNFGEVHLVIQAAFAWWNSHLHEFEIGGLSFGDPEQCENGELADGRQTIDEGSIRLTDFTRKPGTKFTYLYDFGDNWHHPVTIERFISLETLPQTARCIDGARARPPEDVGGVHGYERFVAVMCETQKHVKLSVELGASMRAC